jgi:ActR/RegA family two-component response regulator
MFLWEIANPAYLHAAIMRFTDAGRNGLVYASSGITLGGGVTAQVATGAAQGVGVVGTLLGIAGMTLPMIFKELSERRAQQAKDKADSIANDAEKAELRRKLAESDRRIVELEKLTPQIEATRQTLAATQPKADAAFRFLREAGYITDPAPDVPLVPIRVLVVEDHIPTARALVQFLGDHGFSVGFAYSVGDAIDRLTGPIPFDWMTLDLRIDGGKGEDVLEFVRTRRLSTRVAVTTGSPDRDRVEALKVFRPDRVFMKPVDWTALIKALKSDLEADDPPPPGPPADASATTP